MYREKPELSELTLVDRPIVLRILDRVTARGEQSYVRKVLRSYDSSSSGFLSKDALRTAMDRLALGLDEHGKSKVGLLLVILRCFFFCGVRAASCPEML